MNPITPSLIGITAEWNPFHLGHSAMISEIKAAYPDMPIIAIMSGAFVQRGEPALFDKWSRARWAVEHGIDAVFEFPALYALQSADYFSQYAVDMLAALSVSHVAFSTESLSKEDLLTAAGWSVSEDYEAALHGYIQEGATYGEAAQRAMALCSQRLSAESTQPNNLLGLRYTARILRKKYAIDILPIHRDMEHNISASMAREELLGNKETALLTPACSEEARQLMKEGAYTDPARYEDACLLKSRMLSLADLSASGLFTEGLEHKWHKESERNTYSAMISAIKSKRYLHSTLKRTGAKLLLGESAPSPFLAPPAPCYARLLALRKEKSFLLRNMPLPIVTSVAKAMKALPAEAAAMLAMDIHAQDMQSWCMAGSMHRGGRRDYYTSPVVL